MVEGIGQQLQSLQDDIDALRETPPPHDFTVEQITAWLETLKAAKDENAIHLLIERIDIKNKTDISITSMLTSVLGENGRGGDTELFIKCSNRKGYRAVDKLHLHQKHTRLCCDIGGCCYNLL